MNKFKLFIDNFLVYGIGGIISKIIPLIMIPIITRLMPSSEYFGLSDLSNTLVQFGSAIAIMGMYDAMYRMFFEKEDEEFKKNVCSTAFVFTLITSILVFGIMLLLKNVIAKLFFNDFKYAYITYISAIATLVGATNSIISAPTRMQNKKNIFLIVNTISPLISYGIAIPMLLKGYYTIALPLAAVISGLTIEIIFGIMNKKWFSFKRVDVKLLRQLLSIAIPLLPNFLIYWIFNSCDKVMITNMVGIAAAGVYSVGSKLGHCSQLIYTAFAGGWQYFAFSTMKEKDQVRSNSLVFEYLGIISFVSTAFMSALSYYVFKVLFTSEYINAYIIAPYLFLAPLLQMLFQVASNQFLVVKKTWPNMVILLTGAILNVLINVLLIPVIGIEGAAISTLVGYFISNVICVIVLLKLKLMLISKRFLVSTLCIIIYIILWRILFCNNSIMGLLMASILTFIYILLYKKDLLSIISIKRKVSN